MARTITKSLPVTTEFRTAYRCNKGRKVVYLGLVPQQNKATATVYQHRRGHDTRKVRFLMLPHATTDLPAIKYCECGCGQPAPIANETRRRNGVLLSIKGQPYRFLKGHNKRHSNDELFWRNVDKDGPIHPSLGTACWIWTGSFGRRGYGRARRDKQTVAAHRLSYEMHFGPIPDDMLVCHHCDVPNCVRPDHLFLGTPLDNMIDMHAKGRAAIEGRHGMAKIAETDVPEIRRVHAEGVSLSELGRKYGVVYTTIRSIVRRETWKHIL